MLHTEEDTELAVMEEVAKLITLLIVGQTESYMGGLQWAYQKASDEAHMMTMPTDHTKERISNVIPYKREHSNAHGTVDLTGVAHLLMDVGVRVGKAQWY